MTFTDTERASIRFYLGYPQLFKQQFSRLEGAMNLVGEAAETLALAQNILSQLATIETSLLAALATSGMVGAGNGEVEWDTDNARIRGLRKEGRRWVSRLSSMVGIEILSDAFGEGGYTGDAWLSHGWRFSLY